MVYIIFLLVFLFLIYHISNLKFKYIFSSKELTKIEKALFTLSMCLRLKPLELEPVYEVLQKYFIIIANEKPDLNIFNSEIMNKASRVTYRLNCAEFSIVITHCYDSNTFHRRVFAVWVERQNKKILPYVISIKDIETRIKKINNFHIINL